MADGNGFKFFKGDLGKGAGGFIWLAFIGLEVIVIGLAADWSLDECIDSFIGCTFCGLVVESIVYWISGSKKLYST